MFRIDHRHVIYLIHTYHPYDLNAVVSDNFLYQIHEFDFTASIFQNLLYLSLTLNFLELFRRQRVNFLFLICSLIKLNSSLKYIDHL